MSIFGFTKESRDRRQSDANSTTMMLIVVTFTDFISLHQEDVDLWFHERESGQETEGRQLDHHDADRRHRRLPRRRDPPLRHLCSSHNLFQVTFSPFFSFLRRRI